MLIADNDAVAFDQRRHDHGIAVQKCGDATSEARIPVPVPTNPCGNIGRKPQPSMIGRRNVRDHTVDGTDFDAGSDTLGTVGKHGTSGMGMGQNEEPVESFRDGNFPRVVRTFGRLSATSRRFHDNERSIRAKRGIDTIVTHEFRSRISSRSTALRTALQNGNRSGFSEGQMPSVKTLPASSRPPVLVLNQVWPWD